MPDPKHLVARGYDQIAERHAEWASRVRTEERVRHTVQLLEALPRGASILELGCGAGGVTTQALAAHGRLTGIDISVRSVELARRHVPEGRFLVADMTRASFPPESFDAVVAFYSIIHVPREEHAALFGRIARWLRPDGLFVAALNSRDTRAGFESDWHGVPMYWSGYEPVATQRLMEAAGLRVESAGIETADEDGAPVSFFWIEARLAAAAP